MATNTNITLSKVHHRSMDVNILSQALTYTRNTGVVIGSSSTSVLAVNPSRKTATFTNDSTEEIYLFLSDDAPSTGQGIRLDAPTATCPAGFYQIDVTNLYSGAITAICASGSKNLCVTEGYEGIRSTVTINSNGWVEKAGNTETINSDAYLRELAQTVTIQLDAKIKKLGISKTINSDAKITKSYSETITSDGHIFKVGSGAINSNAHIFKTETKTILSDMFLGYLAQSPPSIFGWAVIA